MIKSITNFLIIFFIFQQVKSQIFQIDQNGDNPFCDETLHIFKSGTCVSFSFFRLIAPCTGCEAPYGFKNVLPLDSNTSLFSVSIVSVLAIQGGLERMQHL